jgi:hypothetical protein
MAGFSDYLDKLLAHYGSVFTGAFSNAWDGLFRTLYIRTNRRGWRYRIERKWICKAVLRIHNNGCAGE